MKKILTMILLIGIIFIPTKLLAAGNVAKIGSTEYATLEEALTAAETGEEKEIELIANATGDDLTLKSGIKLVVPAGKTLNLTGDSKAEAGATILINGLINVDDGVLDVSKVTFGADTGLIKGQDGKIAIKDNGLVVFPDCWGNGSVLSGVKWEPSEDYAEHIFGENENGAGIRVSDGATIKNFAYITNRWVGAIQTTGASGIVYNSTFAKAVTDAFAGDTITLLADVMVPSAEVIINKNLLIDLNGHKLSATNKVLTIEGANVTIAGPGTIQELKPDYGALYVKGSSNAADTNYTNILVGGDVTLIGWSPIFITIASDGTYHAYGVNIIVNGATLDARKDTANDPGNGVYINGNIKDLTNYPNITLNDDTKIISEGNGIYAAGYANWIIKAADIEGVAAGLAIKSGKFTLTNTKVKATGVAAVGESYENGINPTGAAIQVESNNAYAGDIEMVIDGGIYVSEKGITFYEYLAENKNNTSVKALEIKAGDFSNINYNHPTFLVSDSFIETIKEFIKGGRYYNPPYPTFLSEGYEIYGDYEIQRFVVNKINVSPGTKTISGTITNGDTALVQLRQGGLIVKTTTAEDGEYTFTNVAKGIYNLVAFYDGNSIIKVVEVKDANVTFDFTIDDNYSEIIVFGANTLPTIVSGLDLVSQSGKEFIIQKLELEDEFYEEGITAINEQINDTKKDVIYLDYSLYIDGPVLETDNVLDIMILLDLTDKKDVELYRQHEEEVIKFTKLSAKPEAPVDGTYWLDTENNLIHVYASKFSVYAIAYTELTNPQTSDNILTYVLISILSVIAIAGSGIYLNKRTAMLRK